MSRTASGDAHVTVSFSSSRKIIVLARFGRFIVLVKFGRSIVFVQFERAIVLVYYG